jgi:hypothetical protein
VEKRQWSVPQFAEYLARFPGETSQQRWLASGFEEPDALLRGMNPANSAGWSFTSGFKMLAAMRTIVPRIGERSSARRATLGQQMGTLASRTAEPVIGVNPNRPEPADRQ